MIDDDELGSRLARLDPAMSNRVDDDTLDQMLREVSAAPRRRPRHLKLVTALVVGGVVLGAGALPAAATIKAFLAQVVENPPGAGSESIPNSDWIDTRAADIGELVASRSPDDLPLPGGVDRADVVATVAFSIGRMSGITQEIGVDAAYESHIYCRWIDVWLTSDSDGDADGRDYAAAIMMDATAWPARVATDGGGVMESQVRFAEAAADGDRDQVQKAFEFNGCPSWKALGAPR